ncbi:MAG: phosphoribosyl-AMP cyclohydrolase [Pseudomonadota bacterium]
MPNSSSVKPNFTKLNNKEDIEHGTILAPKFAADGTIPAITTDAKNGEVLMFAYMNAEALALSIETSIAHYWSRSRQKLWRKGETSGNEQKIQDICVDCDQDVILLKVLVAGHGASCHNGYKSCFYRSILALGSSSEDTKLTFHDNELLFDPKDVY